MGISAKMLCKWRGKKEKTRDSKKRFRRGRDEKLNCGKEEEMERELHKVFEAERGDGGGFSCKWLVRCAQEIYRRLYPERRKHSEEGEWGYEGFKWSGGCFNGFRERYHLGNMASPKQAQNAPDEMRPILEKWLRFNRRQTYIR